MRPSYNANRLRPHAGESQSATATGERGSANWNTCSGEGGIDMMINKPDTEAVCETMQELVGEKVDSVWVAESEELLVFECRCLSSRLTKPIAYKAVGD